MFWIELWAKFQVVGVIIGIACLVILMGMVAYAYYIDWRNEHNAQQGLHLTAFGAYWLGVFSGIVLAWVYYLAVIGGK